MQAPHTQLGSSKDCALVIGSSDDGTSCNFTQNDLSRLRSPSHDIKTPHLVSVNSYGYNVQDMYSVSPFREGGPASPRSVMSRINAASNSTEARQQECLTKLDTELATIRDEMEEDQASMTAYFLDEARFQLAATKNTIPSTFDGLSPFKNLKPLQQDVVALPSVSVVYHVGDQVDISESTHSNEQVAKRASHLKRLLAKAIPAPERAVPAYSHYIEIERSMLVDRPQLPPNPSTQEHSTSDADKDAAIDKALKENARLAEQSRASEKLSHIGPYLSQINSAYQKCKPDLFEKGQYMPLNLKDMESLDSSLKRAFYLQNSSFSTFQASVAEPAQSPPEALDPLAKTLENYADEGCLICSVHHCHIHGKFVYGSDDDGSESDASDTKSKATDTIYRHYNMPYARMRTRNIEKEELGNESESENENNGDQDRYYCSTTCNLYPPNPDLENEGSWTEEEDALIQACSMQIGKSRQAPCLIAPMLHRSCSQIQLRIEKLSKQCLDHDAIVVGEYKQPKKINWGSFEKEHTHHERSQPTPCDHPGLSCFLAGEKCTCVSNEILCDKFCSCPQDCWARYPGCTCAGPCLSDSCRCQQLNRECDPDLCRTCGAAESVQSKGPISEVQCHNCEIQRGVGKRVVVGESSVEGIGYGLYLAESVRKGDFIAEYVGEIIREAEVSRREALSTRLNSSYFFNLNGGGLTIDASRMGNATRFINHSGQGRNCHARVLLVNSEHRIGFFALKGAEAGTELFFNYGKEFHEREKWKDEVLSSQVDGKTPKEGNGKTSVVQPGPNFDNKNYYFDDDLRFMPENFGEDFGAKRARKRTSDEDEEYVERQRGRRHRRAEQR